MKSLTIAYRLFRSRDFNALEEEIGYLAMAWRSGNTVKRYFTERYYQHRLKRMIKLGWRGWLDVDSELPDRLMPKEYLDQNLNI